MLLQLENSNKDSVAKLLDFARLNHLNLSLIDDIEDNVFLPGKPLSDDDMEKLIINSRQSGIINIDKAHSTIRKYLNRD